MEFHERSFLLFQFPSIVLSALLLTRLNITFFIPISLFFLGWSRESDLLVLLLSFVLNFGLVLFGDSLFQDPKKRAFLGVGLNLVFLVAFKVRGIGAGAGVVPLGFSFYTFQQISFHLDRIRRNEQNELIPSWSEYLFALSFFPHLAAGPIVKVHDLVAQVRRLSGSYWRLNLNIESLALIILGLGKKVFLADRLAPIVNASYIDLQNGNSYLHILHFLKCTWGYGLQVYFDFSAYSDLAIGLALVFGITFPENFDSPYQSSSVSEFWRRWHISLSSWIREYLYSPLKARLSSAGLRPLILIITMSIVGLWHGFGTMYLLWGLGHGTLLAINHAYHHFNSDRRFEISKRLGWVLTLVSVNLLWPFFRNGTLGDVLRIYPAMFHAPPWSEFTKNGSELVLLAVLTVAVCSFPNTREIRHRLQSGIRSTEGWLKWGVTVALSLLGFMAILFSGGQADFLYFRF